MRISIRTKLSCAAVSVLMGTMVMSAPALAAGAPELREISGVTYAYDGEDNLLTSKWIQIDGVWYYASADGSILKGQFSKIGKNTFYFDADGKMQTGFFFVEGEKYYASASGYVQTKYGWLEVDGKWYFTETGGAIRCGRIFWCGNHIYNAALDGALSPGLCVYDGEKYYFDETGTGVEVGWVKIGSTWVFTEKNGKVACNRVISSENNLYYVGEDGMLTEAILSVNGVKYYFNKSGKVLKKARWIQYKDVWYYTDENGAICADQVISSGNTKYYVGEDGTLTETLRIVDGKLRYFDKNGKIKNGGWFEYNGAWYLADSSGTVLQNMLVTSKGVKYYLGEKGMVTATIISADGEKYYFKKDGSMAVNAGWVQYDGKWYYNLKGGGLAQDQVVTVGSKSYLLGEDGVLSGKGVKSAGDKLWYVNDSGVVRKAVGWVKYGGDWYYVSDDGSLLQSKIQEVNGKKYYLGKSGKLLYGMLRDEDGIYHYADSTGAFETQVNVEYDGGRYYADADGNIVMSSAAKAVQSYSSNTSWLFWVDLSEQKLTLFKGSKGNWLAVKEFICSTGTSDHPTPKGEFRTTIHDLSFDSFGYRCWYATGFIGGEYLFHSSPYTLTSKPEVCADSRLGKPTSHGCVRLKLEDAKYLYDNIPLGSKVVIVD